MTLGGLGLERLTGLHEVHLDKHIMYTSLHTVAIMCVNKIKSEKRYQINSTIGVFYYKV